MPHLALATYDFTPLWVGCFSAHHKPAGGSLIAYCPPNPIGSIPSTDAGKAEAMPHLALATYDFTPLWVGCFSAHHKPAEGSLVA